METGEEWVECLLFGYGLVLGFLLVVDSELTPGPAARGGFQVNHYRSFVVVVNQYRTL